MTGPRSKAALAPDSLRGGEPAQLCPQFLGCGEDEIFDLVACLGARFNRRTPR